MDKGELPNMGGAYMKQKKTYQLLAMRVYRVRHKSERVFPEAM